MKILNKFAQRVFVVFLLFGVAVLPAWSDEKQVDASEAHELAMRGDVILVDVRAPEEWKKTGIGVSAKPVSMHLPGFLEKINAIVKGDKSQPIALICATGMRSKRMQSELLRAGYKTVIDVSGGMMGSNTARGWLELGLPTKRVQ